MFFSVIVILAECSNLGGRTLEVLLNNWKGDIQKVRRRIGLSIDEKGKMRENFSGKIWLCVFIIPND